MTTPTPGFPKEMTAATFSRFGEGHLPGHLGVEILTIGKEAVESRMAVRRELLAPNGFLHAASVVALADTSCGYGCVANLPQGARGFTTIELKSNFLGTAREGEVRCRATPAHLGRSTHVWDAVVSGPSGTIALFRCTQMILWPK